MTNHGNERGSATSRVTETEWGKRDIEGERGSPLDVSILRGYLTCTMGRCKYEGRISGTNISKGSVLRVRFDNGIPSTRAHVGSAEGGREGE